MGEWLRLLPYVVSEGVVIMRVRILKDFISVDRSFRAGEVANIDPGKANAWLKAGLVMEDKSLDGAGETKESPPQKATSTKRRTGGKS